MKKVLLIILILIVPFNTMALTDSSRASIVMDIDSGRILYQRNSNTSMLIASTTKIMTFLVTMEYANDKLQVKVKVGEEVLKTYGTSMYLSIGENVKIEDLLYGLMLRSGNDASVVLAKNVAGSIDNFIYLMNLEAENIGLVNTIFKNPHGLDEETKNYSTAYDLAILTRYLYQKYPMYRKISGTKYYDFKTDLKSYSLINRSKIIFDYKNTTTAKTGYTPSSGKSLVTTASNNDLNLLIVTLNNPNHYKDQENMYEYFFENYHNYKILDKNNFKVANSVFQTDYLIKNNFSYPLTKNEYAKLERKIILKNENDVIGSVQIILDNDIIHEEPIYKKEIKKQKENIFKKIKKIFRKIFKKED